MTINYAALSSCIRGSVLNLSSGGKPPRCPPIRRKVWIAKDASYARSGKQVIGSTYADG
jgi:hypothetical protein